MEKTHIEQIRQELTWRIRHEAMYPDKPLDIVKLEGDSEGIHFGLFAGDQLCSVVSLFHEGEVYQFRKFATLPAYQGKGYGSLLLQHIIDYIRQRGGSKIWCNARNTASTFYQRFGFTETDQRYQKLGLDFVIMELQLNN